MLRNVVHRMYHSCVVFRQIACFYSSVIQNTTHTDRTISHVKQEIEELEGIPQDQQRLIYLGKQLEATNTLSSDNIHDGAVLYLILRLRGC